MSKFKMDRKARAKAFKNRATRQGGGFDAPWPKDVSVFKFKEGDNRIRILPPFHKNAEHYGYDVWLHNDIGADKGQYACPKKMKNEPCPICEERERAQRKGEDAEYIKSLAPKNRVLAWVIDRAKEDAGPMLLPMAWTLDRDISSASIDKETKEVRIIDDPSEEGRDVIVTRTGTKVNTEYDPQVSSKARPLSEDDELSEEWLAFAKEHLLPDQVVFMDEDYLKKALAGSVSSDDEDDEEEDDDEKPKSKKKEARHDEDDDEDSDDEDDDKPKKKKSKASDEDDEEDDDADDDDEDNDDEPKKKKKKSKDDEDEDDKDDDSSDDDDDDEDDEDEKPKKKKKKSDEDEDSDDEDDDADDEDDEDEKPNKKGGKVSDSVRKKLKDEDDEEDDDADDDDEDNDDEPKKKKKKSKDDEDEDEDADDEDDDD